MNTYSRLGFDIRLLEPTPILPQLRCENILADFGKDLQKMDENFICSQNYRNIF